MLLAETIGFAAMLWRARYRLDATADVVGRRSVIAGTVGIVGLFVGSIFSQGAGVPQAALVALVCGVAAAGVTYWPWLQRFRAR